MPKPNGSYSGTLSVYRDIDYNFEMLSMCEHPLAWKEGISRIHAISDQGRPTLLLRFLNRHILVF